MIHSDERIRDNDGEAGHGAPRSHLRMACTQVKRCTKMYSIIQYTMNVPISKAPAKEKCTNACTPSMQHTDEISRLEDRDIWHIYTYIQDDIDY